VCLDLVEPDGCLHARLRYSALSRRARDPEEEADTVNDASSIPDAGLRNPLLTDDFFAYPDEFPRCRISFLRV
jgi:hypothetical protein